MMQVNQKVYTKKPLNDAIYFAVRKIALAGVVLTAPCLISTEAVADKLRLEEIVVTARKRTETLQEVPVAVNVVSQSVIESMRVQGIEDLANAVPGLQVGRTTGSSGGSIAMRGISSGEDSSIIDQAVAINIDGVPVNDARILWASMLDLQQVEVMKGPQALFYGKNSPGGVIAIHTQDPGDEFEFMVSGSYETAEEEKRGSLMISGPLSETVKGRLFASVSDKEGIFDVVGVDEVQSLTIPGIGEIPYAFPIMEDSYPSQEDVFVMGTLVFEPSDNFDAKLKYSYYDREVIGGQFRTGQRSFCPYGAPQTLGPIPDDCVADDNIVSGGLPPATIAGLPERVKSKIGGPVNLNDGIEKTTISVGSLELNYIIPDTGLTVTSVTGYYESDSFFWGDATFESATLLASYNQPKVEQYTEELRIYSQWDSPVNFMAGLFFEDKQSDQLVDAILAPIVGLQLAGAPVPIPLGEDEFTQDSQTWSVFAELEWEISDQFTLSGGARISEEEKSLERSIRGNPIMLDPQSETWNNVSPQVTLSYRPAENLMFFASYRTGYKSGGYDGAFKPDFLGGGGVYDLIYDEEEIKGFEVGAKTSWLDDTLQFNATLFSYEYTDLQLASFDSVSISLKILNAGKATTEGAEFEGLWATPIEGLTLRGNLNFLDATFDEFLSDCFTGQSIAGGCNLQPDSNGAFTKQDMSGMNLPFAPEITAGAGFEYLQPISDNWEIGVTGYISYSDDYETNPKNIFGSQQDSYVLTNATVRLASTDDSWEFYLKGTNLGDEYWYARTTENPLTGSGQGTPNNVLPDIQAAVSGGRHITLGFTYRY